MNSLKAINVEMQKLNATSSEPTNITIHVFMNLTLIQIPYMIWPMIMRKLLN